jgi:hypothetical protein
VPEVVAWLLVGLSLALAAWAAVYIALERPLDNPLFYGLATLEVAALMQLVGGSVALATTDRRVESVTFLGYLVTMLLILPLAVVWAISEKSRWGMTVVVVGCLTVGALALRAYQVWTTGV